MKILAFDPGETIGWALTNDAQLLMAGTCETAEEVMALWSQIRRVHKTPDVVIIEDFLGNGPRDQHVIHTLQMLGWLKDHFRAVLKQKVILRAPQSRKSSLYRASELLPGKGPHALDALAHCLAYEELYGTGAQQ